MTRPRDPAGAIGIGAEFALVLVHVVVALSFVRVFDDRSFIGPLLAYVLCAHVSAIAVRRSRAPFVVGVVVAATGAAVVTAVAVFPDTTTWGLPSGATWAAATAAMHDARIAYPDVVAPTAPLPGFVVAAGLALWAAAWFADWTAHRLRATVEAITPAAAAFAFCSVLGAGTDAVATASAFAGASLAFVALQRAANARREHSWSPEAPRATRAALRSAAAIAAVAVLAGALAGVRLPGAGQQAMVDWRGGEGGRSARVTVSPMVELRRRLVEQSDVIAFRVHANHPAYWRLTALDRFDGQVWASDGEFRGADGDLSGDDERPSGTRITQTFDIVGLSAIWAPAAFEATSVRSRSMGLRWDPDSATLIVDDHQATSDGATYTVVSEVPDLDPATLRGSGDRDPASIVTRYEALPADFPDSVSTLAAEVTRGATTRYDRAIALQRFFREQFDYSTEVAAGHGDDALVEFLEDRVGYCEQFAGAFAAMARSLGIPARVAVGFTPGETDDGEPDTYVVRGRYAHAWPEVWFEGIGWVPFEPTPGRGMPGAERYTGVAPEQSSIRGGTITTQTTTTAPTTTAASSPTTARTGTEPQRQRTQTATPAQSTSTDSTGQGPPWAAIVVAVVLAAAAVVALRRRRRPSRTGPLPVGPAERAWLEVLEALGALGSVAPTAVETPRETVARVAASRDGLEPLLGELAELVDEERWAQHPAIDERRRSTIAARSADLHGAIVAMLADADADVDGDADVAAQR